MNSKLDKTQGAVCQVRAHQSISPQDADAFEKVGNRVADCAANLTQKYLAKPVTQALTKLSQECSHSKSILAQHYQMRYEPAELRKRLDSEAATHVVADTKEQQFIDYHVSNPVMYTIPANLFELVHASRWGSLYSDLLLRWLQTLQWPRQPDRRKPAVGITWLELACNFMVTTQHAIPINTAERGQQACYRWVEDDITFDNRTFSFTLATSSFRDRQHWTSPVFTTGWCLAYHATAESDSHTPDGRKCDETRHSLSTNDGIPSADNPNANGILRAAEWQP